MKTSIISGQVWDQVIKKRKPYLALAKETLQTLNQVPGEQTFGLKGQHTPQTDCCFSIGVSKL